MSTFKVPLITLTEVTNHPNADRLDIAVVADSPVIVGRDQWKVGDVVIYVPVGAVLPPKILDHLQQTSKIATKARLKAAKIRGIISQGLILNPKEWNITYPPNYYAPSIGAATDVAEALGITKYEEPTTHGPSIQGVKRVRPGNPNFKYYTDIENIKHYPNVFTPDDTVWVSEKLHGTSFRAGWFPRTSYTLWERVKKFFGAYIPAYEFCYGSRKVDISATRNYKGWYGEDIYGRIARQYDLYRRIPYGYAVYGEIIGPGIQKNYDYGLTSHKLYVYDLLDTQTGKWVNNIHLHDKVMEMNGNLSATGDPLEVVPTLAYLKYDYDVIKGEFCNGKNSTLNEKTTREGVVIKPLVERNDPKCGRVVLKMINPIFLLKDTTDFH